MLWSEKYRPRKLSEFAGNKEAVYRIKQWALQFSIQKKGAKPILLHGPAGCGKSALVSALSAELGMELVQIFPPEKDEAERWEKRIHEMLCGSSLFGAPQLIFIDDIDQWQSSGARSSLSKLAKSLQECKAPLVLCAQDAYGRSISPIRPSCELLPLKSPSNAEVKSIISKISKEEKLDLSSEDLQKIASNCRGDLRAAINDLQAQNKEAFREQEKKQMEIVRLSFRAPNYASTKGTDLGPLMERDTLKLYVAENLPAEFFTLRDLANAYNKLSRADIFDGRVKRRQYWGYLRYSSSLLVWGVASQRRHVRAIFVPYAFPSYIRVMGASKSRRALNKSLCQKISVRTHTTSNAARAFLPLVFAQAGKAKSSAENLFSLSSFYGFDEDELAKMLDISPDSLNGSMKKKGEQK